MGDTALADWADHVAHLRDTFINNMVRRGMRLTRDGSHGATSDATLRNKQVTVTLVDGFPYRSPTVRTNADVPLTWHQERNGNLCLFTARDRDTQPWLDPDAFLDRINLWFINNEAGWPDDHPALDLEVYLDLPMDHRYVVYSNLARLSDDYVRIRPQAYQLRVIGAGKVPKKSTKGILSGYVTDLGELDTPPLNWTDLVANTAEPERIKGAIERGRIDALLIQYTRKSQNGVLAITLPDKQGTKTPHVALSGSEDTTSMQLRAGTAAEALAVKRVYVIGAGALGSHICDGLSRAGLGELTIRDLDILSPGNMTRHLVTDTNLCGTPKAQAVCLVLRSRPYNRTKLHDNDTGLTSPAEAAQLLQGFDLVVDATADGSVTRMLEDAATVTQQRFLTTCMQNEGRTQRVDIVPPYDDAAPLPHTLQRPPTQREVFEAGCGEPVSVTPPHSVAETAAMAVRHIVGILTNQPMSDAGETRDHP